MTTTSTARAPALPRILAAVKRYWGFDALRPLQEQAIVAGLDGRDSLVVMPTGGGKSLCYQVPPLRPIYEAFGGEIPYDVIRLVARHLDAVGADLAAASARSEPRP